VRHWHANSCFDLVQIRHNPKNLCKPFSCNLFEARQLNLIALTCSDASGPMSAGDCCKIATASLKRPLLDITAGSHGSVPAALTSCPSTAARLPLWPCACR